MRRRTSGYEQMRERVMARVRARASKWKQGRVLARVRYIEYESEHRLGGELAIRASEDERNHGLGREHAGTRTRASKGNDETKQGQERLRED